MCPIKSLKEIIIYSWIFPYQERKMEELYYQELMAKELAAHRDLSPRRPPRDGASPRRGDEEHGSYMDQFNKNKNKKVVRRSWCLIRLKGQVRVSYILWVDGATSGGPRWVRERVGYQEGYTSVGLVRRSGVSSKVRSGSDIWQSTSWCVMLFIGSNIQWSSDDVVLLVRAPGDEWLLLN